MRTAATDHIGAALMRAQPLHVRICFTSVVRNPSNSDEVFGGHGDHQDRHPGPRAEFGDPNLTASGEGQDQSDGRAGTRDRHRHGRESSHVHQDRRHRDEHDKKDAYEEDTEADEEPVRVGRPESDGRLELAERNRCIDVPARPNIRTRPHPCTARNGTATWAALPRRRRSGPFQHRSCRAPFCRPSVSPIAILTSTSYPTLGTAG